MEEAFEHERKISKGFLSDAISGGPKFAHEMLKRGLDPPRYINDQGKVLTELNDHHINEDCDILEPWGCGQVIKYERNTCSNGWRYAPSFQDSFRNTYDKQCEVKRRKWQRILVPHDKVSDAQEKIRDFHLYQCAFRSLHPSVIKIALRGQTFVVQLVLEFQRRNFNTFSNENVTFTASDPPPWSGVDAFLLEDPRVFNTILSPVLVTPYKINEGWDILHEFIFACYPNCDAAGWQYNSSANFDDWSPEMSEDCKVRRRLWFRTCVHKQDVDICRSLIKNYGESHERGTIYQVFALKQDRIKTIWLDAMFTLTDKNLNVSIDPLNLSYDFSLCESVVVPLGRGYCGQSWPAVGIRNSHGGDQDMNLVLALRTDRELELFVGALTHQLAIVNLNFWRLEYGPPEPDGITLRGELSKKGHLVPNWKLRTFELRENGILSYYKGSELLGKLNILNGEVVREGNFISITTVSAYTLLVTSKQSTTRDLWFDALKCCANRRNLKTSSIVERDSVLKPTTRLQTFLNSDNTNLKNDFSTIPASINSPPVLVSHHSDESNGIDVSHRKVVTSSSERIIPHYDMSKPTSTSPISSNTLYTLDVRGSEAVSEFPKSSKAGRRKSLLADEYNFILDDDTDSDDDLVFFT